MINEVYKVTARVRLHSMMDNDAICCGLGDMQAFRNKIQGTRLLMPPTVGLLMEKEM